MLLASFGFRAMALLQAVIDTDEGLYLVQAQAWLRGEWPLIAVWDMHPVGGPAMIAGGGLGDVAPDDVGPVAVQEPNGNVDVVVDDEADREGEAEKRDVVDRVAEQVHRPECGDDRDRHRHRRDADSAELQATSSGNAQR